VPPLPRQVNPSIFLLSRSTARRPVFLASPPALLTSLNLAPKPHVDKHAEPPVRSTAVGCSKPAAAWTRERTRGEMLALQRDLLCFARVFAIDARPAFVFFLCRAARNVGKSKRSVKTAIVEAPRFPRTSVSDRGRRRPSRDPGIPLAPGRTARRARRSFPACGNKRPRPATQGACGHLDGHSLAFDQSSSAPTSRPCSVAKLPIRASGPGDRFFHKSAAFFCVFRLPGGVPVTIRRLKQGDPLSAAEQQLPPLPFGLRAAEAPPSAVTFFFPTVPPLTGARCCPALRRAFLGTLIPQGPWPVSPNRGEHRPQPTGPSVLSRELVRDSAIKQPSTRPAAASEGEIGRLRFRYPRPELRTEIRRSPPFVGAIDSQNGNP